MLTIDNRIKNRGYLGIPYDEWESVSDPKTNEEIKFEASIQGASAILFKNHNIVKRLVLVLVENIITVGKKKTKIKNKDNVQYIGPYYYRYHNKDKKSYVPQNLYFVEAKDEMFIRRPKRHRNLTEYWDKAKWNSRNYWYRLYVEDNNIIIYIKDFHVGSPVYFVINNKEHKYLLADITSRYTRDSHYELTDEEIKDRTNRFGNPIKYISNDVTSLIWLWKKEDS